MYLLTSGVYNMWRNITIGLGHPRRSWLKSIIRRNKPVKYFPNPSPSFVAEIRTRDFKRNAFRIHTLDVEKDVQICIHVRDDPHIVDFDYVIVRYVPTRNSPIYLLAIVLRNETARSNVRTHYLRLGCKYFAVTIIICPQLLYYGSRIIHRKIGNASQYVYCSLYFYRNGRPLGSDYATTHLTLKSRDDIRRGKNYRHPFEYFIFGTEHNDGSRVEYPWSFAVFFVARDTRSGWSRLI